MMEIRNMHTYYGCGGWGRSREPQERCHRGGDTKSRGPFGRHRGGPFSGQRGRRLFDAGALRLVVLGLVAAEPRHGYDVIKALESRFAGAYSPSPGAIYPMLQMLEEADLLASAVEGNKRLYSITPAGSAYLKENETDLARINAQIDEVSGEASLAALSEEMQALRWGLFKRLRSGELDANQSIKALEILRAARAALDKL